MRGILITFALTVSLSQAAAPQKADPCALATKAEVSEALGKPVADGKPNPINKTVCDFAGSELGSSVSIMMVDKSPADSADRTVAELKKRKMEASVVAGLGDSAYSASPGYGMQQLGVYKGSKQVIVTVMVPGATAAKSKAVAEQVMKKALTRL
jgi:hypothetical protein